MALAALIAWSLALPMLPRTGPDPTAGSNKLKAGGGGDCEYFYELHDRKTIPVLTWAKCTLHIADLDTGCETNMATEHYARVLGQHDGVDNDDAGHVLAHRLGGSGVEPTNIVPQSPHLNRGDWEAMEQQVYNCAAKHGAKIQWTFQYDSSAKTRPTTMTYAASFGGGGSVCPDLSKTFSNAPSRVDAVSNATHAEETQR